MRFQRLATATATATTAAAVAFGGALSTACRTVSRDPWLLIFLYFFLNKYFIHNKIQLKTYQTQKSTRLAGLTLAWKIAVVVHSQTISVERLFEETMAFKSPRKL